MFNFFLVMLLQSSSILPTFSPVDTQKTDGANIPLKFESTDGNFRGTYQITQFANQEGQLVAIGILTGKTTDTAGNLVGTVSQALTLPVFNLCAVANVLRGHFDLNLLIGLLNRILGALR